MIRRKKTAMALAAAAAVMIAVVGTAGCKRKIEPISKSGFMLNTFVTVTLYDNDDPDILNGSLELCRSYENILSRTIEESEIYRLNHRRPGEEAVTVSEDAAALLKRGLYYSELSEGAFDITVEPLSSLWDFTSEIHNVPPAAEIEAAREKVDFRNMKVENTEVKFASPDTTVDLGAIAKGYIADRMKDYLVEQGVKSAVINLGGNVLCVGSKPDGTPFKVGLQKPYADRNETIGTFRVSDMSVVSSGVYERHFEKNGVNYHHLLDPRTGYPYHNGLVSVTIISDLSVDGDGLSTTCFSLGLEEGMKLIDSIEGAYGVFITEDYQVHYSEGAKQFVEE